MMWQRIVFLLLIVVLSFGLSYVALNQVSKIEDDQESNQMAIALVNEDEGAIFNDREVSFGDEFVRSISRDNTDHDWYVVSRGVAESGFERNLYNMVILIPNDFSEKAIAIDADFPENVVLNYKINASGHENIMAEAKQMASEVLNDFNRRIIDVYFASVIGNLQEAQDHIQEIVAKEAQYTHTYQEEIHRPLASYTDQFNTVSNYSQISKDRFQNLENILDNFSDRLHEDVELNQSYASLLADFSSLKDDHSQFIDSFSTDLNRHRQALHENDVDNMLENLAAINRAINAQFEQRSKAASYQSSIVFHANLIDQYFDAATKKVDMLEAYLRDTLTSDLQLRVSTQLSDVFNRTFDEQPVYLSTIFHDLNEYAHQTIMEQVQQLPSLDLEDITYAGLPEELVTTLENVILLTNRYVDREYEHDGDGEKLLTREIYRLKKHLVEHGIRMSDTVEIVDEIDKKQVFHLHIDEHYLDDYDVTELTLKLPSGEEIDYTEAYLAGEDIHPPIHGSGQFTVYLTLKLKSIEHDIDVFDVAKWDWELHREGLKDVKDDDKKRDHDYKKRKRKGKGHPKDKEQPPNEEEPSDGEQDNETDQDENLNDEGDGETDEVGSDEDEEPTTDEAVTDAEEESTIDVQGDIVDLQDAEVNEEIDEIAEGSTEGSQEEKTEQENGDQEEVDEDEQDETEDDAGSKRPGRPKPKKVRVINDRIYHQVMSPVIEDDRTQILIHSTSHTISEYLKLQSLFESYYGFDLSEESFAEELSQVRRISSLATEDSYYHIFNQKDIVGLLRDFVVTNITDEVTSLVREPITRLYRNIYDYKQEVDQASSHSAFLEEQIIQTTNEAEHLNEQVGELLNYMMAWRENSDGLVEEQANILTANQEEQTMIVQLDRDVQTILAASESLSEQARDHLQSAEDVYATFDAIDQQAQSIQESGETIVLQAHELSLQLSEKLLDDQEFADNFSEVMANSRLGNRQNEQLYHFLSNPVKTENTGTIVAGDTFTPYYIVLICAIVALFTAYFISTNEQRSTNTDQFASEQTFIGKNIPSTLLTAMIGLVEGIIIGVSSGYILDMSQSDIVLWTGLLTLLMLTMLLCSTYLLRQVKVIGMFILLSIFSIYLFFTETLGFGSDTIPFIKNIQLFSPLQHVETVVANVLSRLSENQSFVLTFFMLALTTLAGIGLNLIVWHRSQTDEELEHENVSEAS